METGYIKNQGKNKREAQHMCKVGVTFWRWWTVRRGTVCTAVDQAHADPSTHRVPDVVTRGCHWPVLRPCLWSDFAPKAPFWIRIDASFSGSQMFSWMMHVLHPQRKQKQRKHRLLILVLLTVRDTYTTQTNELDLHDYVCAVVDGFTHTVLAVEFRMNYSAW